jgi:hypothetical protein
MLKVEIRKFQDYDSAGNPYYYTGSFPNPTKVMGLIPSNVLYDITEFCAEINGSDSNFKLSWQAQSPNYGYASPTTAKLGVSAEFTITGAASDFVFSWIINNPVGQLNKCEIIVSHIDPNNTLPYRPFMVDWNSVSGYKSCNGLECNELVLDLQEIDEKLNCLNRFVIFRNNKTGSDYFNPNTGLDHPRFKYYVREKSQLTFYSIMGLLVLLLPLVAVILLLFGVLGQLYRTIFNTGQAHIAPYIRSYIQNICEECGYVFDSTPFNANTGGGDINIGKGSIFNSPSSPYYNATYLHANGAAGVRWTSKYVGTATNIKFQSENSPLITAADFLNSLKSTFNADWFTVNGVLYFQRKDDLPTSIIVDFTQPEAQEQIVGCIEYEMVQLDRPAFVKYEYNSDSVEQRGNYAKSFYNEVLQVAENILDPTFTKGITKVVPFAPAAHSDFNDSDNLLGLFPTFSIIDIIHDPWAFWLVGFRTVSDQWANNNFPFFHDNEAENLLVLSDDIMELPKIIIADTDKPVLVDGYATGMAKYDPQPNIWYNTASIPYATYTTLIRPKVNTPGILIPSKGVANYPMTFDPFFENNLFYYFHFIDDGTKWLSSTKKWKLSVPINATNLVIFKVFAATEIALYGQVQLTTNDTGVITSIDVDYSAGLINLEGFVKYL